MTPSNAILAGSVVIAAAIFASAAVFLPGRGPAPDLAGGPAPTAAPATPSAASDRFQIVKIENGASWRLDRQTGELTYCRIEGDRMICARSSESVELPKVSPDQLKTEREQAEQRQAKEGDAILDKFEALFDRFMKFVERQTGKSPPPPRPDGTRML